LLLQVNNLREIQALRRLSPHPHIIQLLEVLYDQPTGRLALVFELMVGAAWLAWLQQLSSHTKAAACCDSRSGTHDVMLRANTSAIAGGLARSASNGRPSNIMLYIDIAARRASALLSSWQLAIAV
jgi:serine/threonine protein kinase